MSRSNTDYLDSIKVTPEAVSYLGDLLKKQDGEGIGVRMFVLHPGTPNAETCLSYCHPGEENEDDAVVDKDLFKLYFEQRSLSFLEDAVVDYNQDRMGGQLTIKAPNSRMPKLNDDSTLEDRVNYILWNDINPSLAAHGGQVSLIEMTDDRYAVLQFGGGCQGCSQLDLTLREGVEKNLLSQLPDLAGVRDMTDHSDTSNAYYK